MKKVAKVKIRVMMYKENHSICEFIGYGPGYDGSNRGYLSDCRVAGRHTMTPKFMEEICSAPDLPSCNPDYLYRTIMGECNNLG